MDQYNQVTVDDYLRRTGKQPQGFNYPAGISDAMKQGSSLRSIANPVSWSGLRVAEHQWLLQQKRGMTPSTNAIAQSLRRVPEINAPVLRNPEWLKGMTALSRNAGGFLAQINRMVERVASTMATPMARMEQINEQITRPVRGWQQLVANIPSFSNFNRFWEGIQPVLQNVAVLLEDVESGREVLRVSDFGFAEHFWGIFYIRSFAHIDERVRPAVVTNRLLAFTSSEEYVEQLQDLIDGSKLMHKRWRIIESVCDAHASKKYDLAVPAALAQIEGILVDLMLLKDLVKKEKGKFYLVEENGDFKLTRDGKKRLAPVTLSPAVRNAQLEEHPNLVAASEVVANTLVQRRNDVLHGHDLTYGKAKFSVQACLILAVLAEAVAELET